MAVAPLNLSPAVQAWHAAGLNHLLLDAPVAALLAESGLARPERISGAAGQASPPSGNYLKGVKPARIAPPERKAPVEIDVPVPAEVRQASRFEPELLPEPWKAVLQKVQPGPVVWIYPELGADLLGLSADAGGSARSLVLRQIIAGLKLKKGTSTFWPVNLPQTGDERSETSAREFFHGGLDYLGAKYLVVFGQEALQGTDYASLKLGPFSEQVAGGRLILGLPEFSVLLAERARLESVAMFLHTVFSRIILN